MGAPMGGMGAGTGLSSFRPLQLAALAGLIVAVISVVLPWLKISGGGISQSFKAIDKDIYKELRIADWAGNPSFPLDAIIIAAVALVGLYLILGPILSKGGGPNVPFVVAAGVCGAVEAVIGILNYLFIHDQIKDADGVSIGFGLYVLIAAGIATAALAFIDYQQQSKL